jgi:dolichol-phosphate hexosyltransferase
MRGLFIMLPTLDEEEALPQVHGRIPFGELEGLGWKPRVFVVDGGSCDLTEIEANKLGCDFHCQWGEGKGAGMRQAFEEFLASDEEVLVMLDSDGTYSPEEIPLMIESLPDGGVAIGDRLRGNLKPDAMSPFNWIGNHLLTWMAVSLHGQTINDLCSGYWAFTREAIEKMQLNSIRFEIEAEMYTCCVNRKIPMNFVPISYSKRTGFAKLGSLKDGSSIARKLIIRKLFPLPIEAKK